MIIDQRTPVLSSLSRYYDIILYSETSIARTSVSQLFDYSKKFLGFLVNFNIICTM